MKKAQRETSRLRNSGRLTKPVQTRFRCFFERPDGRAVTAGSGRAEVDRLRTLAHAVGFNVEGDLLAVDEGTQARGLDRGNVDEHILGAAVGRDEAEAFGRVEEFNGAGLGHWGNSFTRVSLMVCPPPGIVGKSRWLLRQSCICAW